MRWNRHMAILSLRQEVCEIPQRWCGDGHVTCGFNIRNPQQINWKCYQISWWEKRCRDKDACHHLPGLIKYRWGGGDKSNKTKMSIVFFIVTETLHPLSNKKPVKAQAYCVKLFQFPVHKLSLQSHNNSQKCKKKKKMLMLHEKMSNYICIYIYIYVQCTICRCIQGRKMFNYYVYDKSISAMLRSEW